MHRVLVNVASCDWAVHFIAPDGKTRIGPWLLHDTPEVVLKILRWCGITTKNWLNITVRSAMGMLLRGGHAHRRQDGSAHQTG